MDTKRLMVLDKGFLLVLFLVVAFGMIVLASAGNSVSSDPFYYMKRQMAFFIVGVVCAIIIMRYDLAALRKYSLLLYILVIVILIAVLIFGVEQRGTKGWIGIGSLPALQPAEFTKVLLIIAFADFLARRQEALNSLKEIIPALIFMGVPFVLIMLQPDLGTALVYIAITVVMLFMAGANPRIMIGLIASAVAFIALWLFLHFQFGLWLPLDDYQIDRLVVFVDPYNDGQGGRGAGWNIIQALIAIGSGGWMGKGLFHGTQVQLNFLPEQHTDFIYAVIGEELGFLGAALVLVLYLILLLRVLRIAWQARHPQGVLIVIGITAMWGFHIVENIGMSIGILPITGIPLPFLSYGGSNMITNMLAVGLILNINFHGKELIF